MILEKPILLQFIENCLILF